MKYVYLNFLLLIPFLSACTSKEDTATTPKKEVVVGGGLVLNFDNVVGVKNLVLATDSFYNHHNESFKVSALKYFVSNIALQKSDSSIYTLAQDSSYFLVDESAPEKLKLTLRNIPEGTYKKIYFNLGVDSLRSTMGPEGRKGALDIGGEALGMYWTWNSGYIHYKLEGESSAIKEGANTIQIHVGGFGGYSSRTANNNRLISLDFPAPTSILINKKPSVIHIQHDILKTFNGPALDMRFSDRATYMSGEGVVQVANNYQQSFSITKIEE